MTADRITRNAALDPTLEDSAFIMISRAVRGLDPITGEREPIVVPVRTPDDLPAVDINLADYRDGYGGWEDDTHGLAGTDGPDVDGNVLYVGNHGYRHDQLPHLIAWLTATYHASSPENDD